VEASSKGALAFAAQVDVTAAKGGAGQVLLDPKNITIGNGANSPNYTVTPLTYGKPQAGDQHGLGGAEELSNGNIVVASPYDNTVAKNAGAVRLYKQDGTLISTLTGGQADDRVGDAAGSFLSRSTWAIPVGNSNFVVRSGNWANGTVVKAGAVTWGSGTAGVSGLVSSSNSLVGSQADDQVGHYGVTVLTNGNYAVASPYWANGTATRAGAVTWGDGNKGISGVVSSSNSLVGGQMDDQVGERDRENGIHALSNGNYVVSSHHWANGTASEAGAVTWGDGSKGITGVVSSSNSLVGTQEWDKVGVGGIRALANGNYVVVSYRWANGTAEEAGAMTWGSGTAGVSGEVSSSNSLVGTQTREQLGTDGRTLSNGNYVVLNSRWNNGAGAVTWGSGTAGVTGVVSSSNSLVGTQANDGVGSGIYVLSNDNYVVLSEKWANGTAARAGAVTWGSGTAGVTGVVGSSNSLVGAHTNDEVGRWNSIKLLTNGNYVVTSTGWANGTAANAGAVTWGSSTAGVSGVVSSSNSLVGSQANDFVGGNRFSSPQITVLSNGNYVVASSNWANGTATEAGAVTWGDGSKGITGVVGSSNSLVGVQAGDMVGFSVTALSNGNYVVDSHEWANGTAAKAGAVTWGSGIAGITGVVSSSNSLVGSQRGDGVGSSHSVFELSNGNYVVASSSWANGTAANAGAVTWGSGTAGITGVVSSSNSLVGSRANDQVGSGPPGFFGQNSVVALNNGNYVVSSPYWANGMASEAGAVTWGDGSKGITGVVGSSNSLVGSQVGDRVGSGVWVDRGITALRNGNYVVSSLTWANDTAAQAGAITWGNGLTGITGVVSSSNSLVGSQTGDMGGSFRVIELSDGNYVVGGTSWANGTASNAGAVTWGSGVAGVAGAISSSNSLVGTQANDKVGADISALSNGSVLVRSPAYNSNQGRVDILSFGQPNPLLYALDPGANYNLNVGTLANLLATGAQVTLQANTDISLLDALKVNSGAGGGLTLQAGRSILLHADVSTGNGGLTLIANDRAASGVVDAHRDAGAGDITQAAGTTIDAGTGTVDLQIRDGLGIANAQAGNITLARVLAGDLKIDSHGLTATLAAQNKVYDGNTVAAATSSVTGLVLQAGSNLSLVPTTARFADKNVATGKTVTADALQITGFHGAQASALHSDGQVLTPTATADISQRVLNVTATAANKVYDGNTAASIRFGDDRVGGDVLSLAGIGNFDTASVGRGKTVSIRGITLGGADAGNYSFPTTLTALADITQKSAPLPDPDRQARDFIQQQERDFAEPTQTALDLTVWGAKAPAQQLQQLNGG
jgi:hypothetical protein